MAVTAAQENFGIALQLGGSYARAKFFKFLDEAIRSIDDTKMEKSSSQADGLLQEVVEEANKQQVGRSLAKPVPVVVSFAGPVQEDAKTATPGNFEINGEKEAINLEKHLNGIQPNGVKFEVKVLNDAAALINAAAISNKNLLEPGDKVYHAIMGTGMGGAGGTITEDGVTEINANEPGHEIMPDLFKYRFIEGEDRQRIASPLTNQKGYVELYTAGGNTDDRGLVATLSQIKKLRNRGTYESRLCFNQAVDLLNSTLGENDVKITINEGDIQQSSIMQRTFMQRHKYSNQEITQAAMDGDKFAQALVTFTLIRASQALAQSINSQGKQKPLNSQKKEEGVALVSINGSFNRGLREAVDPNGELQFRVLNAELKKLGHPGIKDNNPQRLVQFDPELDGTPLILEERFKKPAIS